MRNNIYWVVKMSHISSKDCICIDSVNIHIDLKNYVGLISSTD